ncbi:MAG: glycosyltransferase family 2 protein [Bacteroidales bacterium]|nr:glycosyltransferase family 2 protein [Bacteroidales bacterium]MDY2710796.1 glycosyltransferase family 2 protein [Sodaliphilus sp.]
MLISVVIPVYNTSSYLARCIDSIFEQDLKDVELIFIDDCSTDNSFEVLNQCLKGRESENLTIVKNPKNLGSGETRNKGISLAKGDYVIFVDSDDYVTSKYFQILKNAIESRPDIVVFDMTEIWTNKTVLKHVDLPDSPLESVELLLLNKMHNSLCNKMFKRSMFLKHDIRITKGLSMFEDKSICFKLFYYAKSQLFINKSLYFYDRSRENSLTKVFKESNIQASVIVAKVIDDFFKDKEVSDNIHNAIQANKVHVLGYIGLYCGRTTRSKYANELGKLSFSAFSQKCKMPIHYRIASFAVNYKLYPILFVIRRLYFLCK